MQVRAQAGLRGECSGRSKLRELASNHEIAFRVAKANQDDRKPHFQFFFFLSLAVALLHPHHTTFELFSWWQPRHNSTTEAALQALPPVEDTDGTPLSLRACAEFLSSYHRTWSLFLIDPINKPQNASGAIASSSEMPWIFYRSIRSKKPQLRMIFLSNHSSTQHHISTAAAATAGQQVAAAASSSCLRDSYGVLCMCIITSSWTLGWIAPATFLEGISMPGTWVQQS